MISFLATGPQVLHGAIGTFVLILAVFNYINISILMATKRLKEIGFRKVIESQRSQLMIQFLTENLIVCLLAICFGCLLAVFIFLPGFNQIASKSLKIGLFNDPYILAFLIGLTVFITLASGLYSASFVSSFKPINILKGYQQIGSKSILTSVLLTFQFTLAIISIVAEIAFLQMNYPNENRDWGYDNADKIMVNVPESASSSVLKNKLSTIATVEAVSKSQHYVGNYLAESSVTYNDQDYEIDLLLAEANYPEILGMKLKAGRFLDSKSPTE